MSAASILVDSSFPPRRPDKYCRAGRLRYRLSAIWILLAYRDCRHPSSTEWHPRSMARIASLGYLVCHPSPKMLRIICQVSGPAFHSAHPITTSLKPLSLLPPTTFSSIQLSGAPSIAPTTQAIVATNCHNSTNNHVTRKKLKNLTNSFTWYRSFWDWIR